MENESEKELFQFSLKFCIHFSIGIFYMFVAKQTILDNLLVQSEQYTHVLLSDLWYRNRYNVMQICIQQA